MDVVTTLEAICIKALTEFVPTFLLTDLTLSHTESSLTLFKNSCPAKEISLIFMTVV